MNESFLAALCGYMRDLWVVWSFVGAYVFLASPTLLFFAEKHSPACENKIATWPLALYVTLITFLTVGYGDLVPKSICGRVLAVMNGFVGVTSVGLWIAVLSSAIRGGQ